MDQLFANTPTLDKLRNGPLGPHLSCLDDLANARLGKGYAPLTVKHQVQVVAQFGEWLSATGLGLFDVTDLELEEFRKHGMGPTWTGRGMFSLTPEFVAKLRHDGVIKPVLNGLESASDRMVEQFGLFLRQERGVVEATRKHYTPIIRGFLVETFGPDLAGLSAMAPADVTAYVRRHAHRYSHGHVVVILTALRVFLKYLLLTGNVETDLSGSVPAVANWQLQGLPKGLAAEEVEKLLGHCDVELPAGLRDTAILLLLARLGLRAGDVVHLELEDIDWDAGEILLTGKSRRLHRLPLPEDAGKAIAAYLKHERPDTKSRRVFVRAYAPFESFRSSVAICCIMRRALRRAGLTPPRKGAHLLRHSLATRMLRGGASLTEIGQILRHHLQDTTRIYAKVDQDALKPLARQWLGGGV